MFRNWELTPNHTIDAEWTQAYVQIGKRTTKFSYSW
jgi:hypothetical protein